jgi:hypothetical protein
MMCPAIVNPTSCEIRPVIRFLHAKSMSAAEIHRELRAVYCQNVISEENVRQLCRMLKDWRTYVHDEERSGRTSVVSDDFARSERRHFIMSEVSCEFSQISRTVLTEIITIRLGYHKFCATWVPKMLTCAPLMF